MSIHTCPNKNNLNLLKKKTDLMSKYSNKDNYKNEHYDKIDKTSLVCMNKEHIFNKFPLFYKPNNNFNNSKTLSKEIKNEIIEFVKNFNKNKLINNVAFEKLNFNYFENKTYYKYTHRSSLNKSDFKSIENNKIKINCNANNNSFYYLICLYEKKEYDKHLEILKDKYNYLEIYNNHANNNLNHYNYVECCDYSQVLEYYTFTYYLNDSFNILNNNLLILLDDESNKQINNYCDLNKQIDIIVQLLSLIFCFYESNLIIDNINPEDIIINNKDNTIKVIANKSFNLLKNDIERSQKVITFNIFKYVYIIISVFITFALNKNCLNLANVHDNIELRNLIVSQSNELNIVNSNTSNSKKYKEYLVNLSSELLSIIDSKEPLEDLESIYVYIFNSDYFNINDENKVFNNKNDNNNNNNNLFYLNSNLFKNIKSNRKKNNKKSSSKLLNNKTYIEDLQNNSINNSKINLKNSNKYNIMDFTLQNNNQKHSKFLKHSSIKDEEIFNLFENNFSNVSFNNLKTEYFTNIEKSNISNYEDNVSDYIQTVNYSTNKILKNKKLFEKKITNFSCNNKLNDYKESNIINTDSNIYYSKSPSIKKSNRLNIANNNITNYYNSQINNCSFKNTTNYKSTKNMLDNIINECDSRSYKNFNNTYLTPQINKTNFHTNNAICYKNIKNKHKSTNKLQTHNKKLSNIEECNIIHCKSTTSLDYNNDCFNIIPDNIAILDNKELRNDINIDKNNRKDYAYYSNNSENFNNARDTKGTKDTKSTMLSNNGIGNEQYNNKLKLYNLTCVNNIDNSKDPYNIKPTEDFEDNNILTVNDIDLNLLKQSELSNNYFTNSNILDRNKNKKYNKLKNEDLRIKLTSNQNKKKGFFSLFSFFN